MNLLLDSYVLLWYDDPGQLNAGVRREIDRASRICVSAATVWELTLKQTIGKLSPQRNIIELATHYSCELLVISASRGELAGKLPLHHRDPFDRMLVAQAMIEGLTLVTHDATLSQYDVPILRV